MYGTEKTMVILGIVMSLLLVCASVVFFWYENSQQDALIASLRTDLTELQRLPGPQGIAGISITNASVNASGHLIITLSNGSIIDAGNTIGAAGTTGTPGSIWYTGTTAPSNTLGIIGDWYLDAYTGNAYEKTGTTVWTLRCNLRGPQGYQGAQGPPGP